MQVTPKAIIVTIIHHLVGGFNPFEKIWVKMGIFPNFRGENQTYLSFHHQVMVIFSFRPSTSHLTCSCHLFESYFCLPACLSQLWNRPALSCPNSNCLQTINVQFICIHSNFIASCNTPSHNCHIWKVFAPPHTVIPLHTSCPQNVRHLWLDSSPQNRWGFGRKNISPSPAKKVDNRTMVVFFFRIVVIFAKLALITSTFLITLTFQGFKAFGVIWVFPKIGIP